MIVVKVELWPGGDGSRATEIARAYIANTGQTKPAGRLSPLYSYDCRVVEVGAFHGIKPIFERVRINNYDRRASVWKLIHTMLHGIWPEKKCKTKARDVK